MQRFLGLSAAVAACLLLAPAGADAYIGPGAGITAIGTVIAFFAAVVFAIVGFVWYPIKRLLGLGRSRKAAVKADQTASTS
jgi:hypothetical protein